MFEQNHFKSIDELVKFFPTEQSCIDFFGETEMGRSCRVSVRSRLKGL